MKNGSTPNPARDAAETKEAYIVVEIFQGCYGDCNLFFSGHAAVTHILETGKDNPNFPKSRNEYLIDPDRFLFELIPNYQHRLTLNAKGDDSLFFHIRKISLSHQQANGSAAHLDATMIPQDNSIRLAAKALADHFEAILQESDNPLCEPLWKELEKRGWDIEQTQPGTLDRRSTAVRP